MNVLPFPMRVRIASALSEGVSLRSTERLTGVTRKTIGSFLLTLGDGCAHVHGARMHDLTCDVLELDEVWAYVGCKEAHRGANAPEEFGDAYTFVALDATSRAVVSHLTDKRSTEAATVFAKDLRARVTGKPQLTTDGFSSYLEAIEAAFGERVNYAQILKTYWDERESDDAPREDMRLSGRRVVRSVKRPVVGTPDEDKISTSYVERSNLTTRMWNRRLTRLTTCFSRRLVFLRAAMTMHYTVYNFVRVHSKLRVTPAMQLGVTDHIWSMEELVTEALRALEDAPPNEALPAPPTPGIVPAVRARAAGATPATTAGATPATTAGATPATTAGTQPVPRPAPATMTDDYRWLW